MEKTSPSDAARLEAMKREMLGPTYEPRPIPGLTGYRAQYVGDQGGVPVYRMKRIYQPIVRRRQPRRKK